MSKTYLTGLLLKLMILIVLASSCASSKPPYHRPKPKKPAKCDCSRWSYQFPSGSFYHLLYDEGLNGRA